MGRRWTPEEVEQLKQFYDSGMKVEDIGKALVRHKSSVQSKLKTANISKAKEQSKAKEKRKFTEGAKIALGYYDNCVI